MTDIKPTLLFRPLLTALASSFCFVFAVPAQAQDGAQTLPSVTLSVGMHNIRVEVAQSPDERAIGLMHRTTLGISQGMLFVFEQPAVQCFWMKNTLLPLAIAFLDDAGSIVNIDEMKPQSLDSHCSTKPARYVLEMNTHWFDKRGIKVGTKLHGGPFPP